MIERNENKNTSFITHNKKSIVINSLWQPPTIENPDNIPKGDMPGDQIKINDGHLSKANTIFPELLKEVVEILNRNANQKAVISVHGGSGVGKSEIGALLAYYFNDIGIGSYVLSGDNYPRRIPFYNDAERLRIFRMSALLGLVKQGEYDNERQLVLNTLILEDKDADINIVSKYPWLEIYQNSGREGLSEYLGSKSEIDFSQINGILHEFKNGKESIMLKRMGRKVEELWYDDIDFSSTNILIIEWTHGNNKNLVGVDLPILLNSTPEETLEHRRLRNRDGGLDSPFTTMVLSIEQLKLHEQAKNAKMIVSKDGEIIPYSLYERRMKIKWLNQDQCLMRTQIV